MRVITRTLIRGSYSCSEEAKTVTPLMAPEAPFTKICSSLTHKHSGEGKCRNDRQIGVGGGSPFHRNSYLCSLKRWNVEMQNQATVFTWWKENLNFRVRTKGTATAEHINNSVGAIGDKQSDDVFT